MDKQEKERMDRLMIAPLEVVDAEAVAILEQEIFGMPWSLKIVSDTIEISKKSEKNLCGEENPPMLSYISLGAFWDGKLAGYLFAMAVAGEGELHRIAVAEKYRRMGIAGRLMEGFFSWLLKYQSGTAALEVRAGNQAAVSLYKKYGFSEEGRRRAYYKNPTEDALIFLCHQFPLSCREK